MQNNGFRVAKYVVAIGVFLVLVSFFFPRHHGSRLPRDRSQCKSNLQQIGLGFRQYVQDYDEKFPPFDANSQSGWVDLIQPYLKSAESFQCPSTTNGGSNLTDYFYNLRLSKAKEINLNFPERTVLSGDGSDNSPSNYALSKLPTEWLKEEASPARRHLDGANYAFADGHVKWFIPQRITESARTSSAPTFAIEYR